MSSGNGPRVAALIREWQAALRQGDARLRRFLLKLVRRVSADETVTVGALRSAGRPEAGPIDRAVTVLTQLAVSILVAERWLGRTQGSRQQPAARLLRGVVIDRLLASPAPNGARAGAVLDGLKLVLPRVGQPAPTHGRQAALTALRQSAARVGARAEVIGLGRTITLAELAKADLGDLTSLGRDIQQSAAKIGMPGTMTLQAFEEGVAAEWVLSEPWTRPVLDPILPPPSLPVLDGRARVLGRGDLMLVRVEHLRYELGEIAYVENVLQSELRQRTHVIDTATSERIVETQNLFTETSQELSTTERTDLQRAAETVNTTATSLSAGVNVSGGFGPISVGLDLNASRSTSTTESNSSATSYAKEVTEQASETVRSQTSSKVVTTNRTRLTETNRHDFDARNAAGHIRGVYRWINKVDRAQVYNYGERLLLEFVVPEPAAQHVYLNVAAAAATTAVPEPPPLDFGPQDLTDLTYQELARRYGVVGLEAPPPELVAVATTIVIPAAKPFEYPEPDKNKDPDPEASQPTSGYSVTAAEVVLPEGYEPVEARMSAVFGSNLKPAVTVSVGGETAAWANDDTQVLDLTDAAPGPLPVVVGTHQSYGVAVAIRVEGRRIGGAREAWQLRTFDLIQQAYLAQQSAFEAQAAAAAVRKSYTAATPSTVNRAIERRELKRGCQTILTGQDFSLFGSVTVPGEDAVAGELPEMDLEEAWTEADVIQFFEDALEYDLMAYVFYPYQWAGRERWSELALRTSSDPLHEAFLQAGAARVVVPVREGYEPLVGRYLKDGQVPRWGPAPWRGQPSGHVSVDELIADANDRPGEEVAIGDPWEVTVPTTLIYLQEDAELNPVVV
jgi:hypothetical protein